MKSFFTKLGGLLLCGVMFTAVGCHDYSADIKEATDKLDQELTTDIAALQSEIQTLKNEAATAAALSQAIADFNAGINGLKTNEIKALQDAMAGKANSTDLTALSTTVAGISTKVDGLETQFNTAIAGLADVYATKTELTAAEQKLQKAIEDAIAGVNSSIEKINKDITAINTALDGKADKTDLAKVEADVEKLEGDITTLSARLDAAEDEIEKNAGDIAKVAADLTEAQSALTTAIATAKSEAIADAAAKVEAAKSELTAAIATAKSEAIADAAAKVEAAKSELTAAIATAKDDAIKAAQSALDAAEIRLNAAIDAAKETAIEAAQDKVDAAVETLNAEIVKAKDAAIEAAAESAQKMVNDAKTELDGKIATISTTVASLADRLTAVEVDVKNLINSIQSIVYRPTHANGVARISSAKIGGMTLEGNSTLTYKVYPAAYADSLVNAFKNNESFLSYDLISVTKSTDASLIIKDVQLSKDASDKDIKGQIDVVVRANGLSASFYAGGSDSYSAALILANNNDHYSTEYTNLCVDPVASTYDLVLYKGGELLPDGTTLENDVVFNNKVWKQNLFDGVEPMFKSAAGEVLDFDAFAKKYTLNDAKIEIENTIVDEAGLFAVTDEKTAVNATLKESYHVSNVGKKLQVKTAYNFGWDGAIANAEVELVAFPYTLMAEATAKDTTFAYNKVPEKPFTFLADYRVFFKGADGEVSIEEIEKTYFLKMQAFVNKTVTPATSEELFDVTEDIPVQITLAVDSDNNPLAKAENVGDTYEVYYKWYDSVLEQSVATDPAKAKITKTQYSFEFAPISTEWTYTSDAVVDATGTPSCSREYPYEIASTDITGTEVPADQNISKVFADAASLKSVKVNGTVYEGTTLADSPVSFVSVDADNVKIVYDELKWAETYVVEALFDRASAEVTVKAEIVTVDRKRDAIVIDLGEVTKPYFKNFIYDASAADAEVLPLGLLELLKNEYLGNTEDVDFATATPIFDANTDYNYVVDAGNSVGFTKATVSKTGLQFNAEFTGVTYGFHYGNLVNLMSLADGASVPKAYDYSASFKTWYGQEVTVNLGFNFSDPDYDYASVYQYVLEDNGVYYAEVQPKYTNGSTLVVDNALPIDAFSVNDVNLNTSFVVVGGTLDPNAADYTTQLADLGIVRTFELEGTYPGINLTNNLIKYDGYADAVGVKGYISIENDVYDGVKTVYEISETSFDNKYASFEVRKFDPINALKPINAATQLKVVEPKVYTIYVLNNFKLTDKRGHDLIAYSETANGFVVGNDSNGFVSGKLVTDIYAIETPTYNIEVTGTDGAPVTGITVDNTTGTIKIDNTGQFVYQRDVNINVSVTVKYPQTEGKTSSYVLTIKK